MTRLPELRRRLLIIGRDDYNHARSSSPELLVNPFTTVAPVPLRTPWTEVPELVALEDSLQPGMLLIRNQWRDGKFVEATSAHEDLTVARFNHFAATCQQLGARHLTAHELREYTSTAKIAASLELGAKAVNARGRTSNEKLDQLATSIRASWTWQAGESDVAAAAKLAEKTGLAGDPMIDGLIQQRKSTVNPLEAHELELDVNAEARRELSAALELQSLLGRLGPTLASTFDLIRNYSQQVRLVVELNFGS